MVEVGRDLWRSSDPTPLLIMKWKGPIRIIESNSLLTVQDYLKLNHVIKSVVQMLLEL